jgi:hypothetical protein
MYTYKKKEGWWSAPGCFIYKVGKRYDISFPDFPIVQVLVTDYKQTN